MEEGERIDPSIDQDRQVEIAFRRCPSRHPAAKGVERQQLRETPLQQRQQGGLVEISTTGRRAIRLAVFISFHL